MRLITGENVSKPPGTTGGVASWEDGEDGRAKRKRPAEAVALQGQPAGAALPPRFSFYEIINPITD